MNTSNSSQQISKIARLLKKSKSILFITGAGISSDSGLPTYRGIGGLYNNTVTDEGIPIETILAGQTLAKNPALTWKYLQQIEKNAHQACPNRGHKIIAQMQEYFKRIWVLTQNIDGFHKACGSRNVIDIHGDMHKIFCTQCGWRINVKDYSEIEIPPLCPKCLRIARPDVVFFGELLPSDKIKILMRELTRGFDIYFSIGTSSVFPYIQQPVLDAKSRGLPTVEINPSDTEVSHIVDIKLSMRASEALDAVWKEYLLN